MVLAALTSVNEVSHGEIRTIVPYDGLVKPRLMTLEARLSPDHIFDGGNEHSKLFRQ